MTNDLFHQARQAISRSLIERVLHQPGARWEKGEYWTLNPLRNDRSIGSFHISESGQWFDHATDSGGDLIDLIAEKQGITKLDAAKKIIEESGQTVSDKKKQRKKPDPVIPVPDEAFEALNKKLTGEWSIKKHGNVTSGWRWKTDSGVWCCTARHERDGEKDVIPYYYGTDGKWHQGCPATDSRPLYRAGQRPDGCRVLIVEGEKCAEVPVDGFIVDTWIGGTGQVKKADWGELSGYDVTIWPDADGPGMRAAEYIAARIPGARILRIDGRPQGWDIYDAREEGIDLVKFIEEAGHENIETAPDILPLENGNAGTEENAPRGRDVLPAVQAAQRTPGGPFVHLGYDDSRHYFLPYGSRVVLAHRRGSFTRTRLLELAPLSWWEMEYPKKGGYDVDVAIDTIIRDSERAGIYQSSRIRGTGVWMHNGSMVVNNGDHVTDMNGNQINPVGGFHYVKSEKRMGDFSGPMATTENGYDLIKLFLAQGFETEIEGLQLLGWSLIAPFGGILKWRPHVWLTGPSKAGKSHVLENFVEPLLRPFYHRGTGKTSSPGIYRAIKNTACPIILDEMEPGRNANKETIQKIEEKLELARNASSDFSSVFTLTSMSGSGLTEEFCVRSAFLFASILPYMTGEAIESRILVSRLKNMSLVIGKIKKTAEIMKTGILDDPMIFQRRIFRNIETVLRNIEITRRLFLRHTGDQRKSDNLAPIFSALASLVDDGNIPEEKIENLVEAFVTQLSVEKTHTETDEDKLMSLIFGHIVQLQYGEKKTIAELIELVVGDDESLFKNFDSKTNDNHIALQQLGVRLCTVNNVPYLAISTGHGSIRKILADTVYYGNYSEVIKRHEAKVMAKSTRFAAQVHHALLLDWQKIKKKYFVVQEDESDFQKLVEDLI